MTKKTEKENWKGIYNFFVKSVFVYGLLNFIRTTDTIIYYIYSTIYTTLYCTNIEKYIIYLSSLRR